MNHPIAFKQRLAGCACLAVAAVSVIALFPAIGRAGGDAKSPNPPEKTSEHKGLSGSELYAIHCNRCHSERYPKECQASQWKTLLTHMRVRANLPASQARELLKYLQEECGN